MPHIAELYRTSLGTAPTAGSREPAATVADVGLLVLRLVVGLLMAGHGSQKLFGWFGGSGLTETGKSFAALGYHPGKVFATIGGCSELLGGLGLALGLLTPLAAAILIGTMINAMAVGAAHGLWSTSGGIEYPLVIAIVAIAVTATGPGRLSLDRLLFSTYQGSARSVAFAIGLGGVAAAVALTV